MDKLWAMEVFVRVSECGSFSRAAESLNLANATVTSCIRNLEKHLGVTLLQRNTRHLQLTEEGRIFLPRCQSTLRDVAQAESDVKISVNEIAGALRIELPFGIGQTLLCPALPAFAARHPGLSLWVTLTNEPHNLIERATDVALRMDRVEDADLVARPVYETRYIVCGAPEACAALNQHDPRELDPGCCLGLFKEGERLPNQWVLRQGDCELIIRPQGALHYNNTRALTQAAADGVGLIYVLDVFAADLIAEGKLVQLFPDWETATRTFYAVTIKARFATPKIRAFIDFLLEIFDARQRPSMNTPIPVGPDRRRRSA
jgi:LysR family transcriptional regulator for bpeEF and oprC